MLKHDDNAAKSFDILAISLSILCSYFDDSTKLFLDLYLVKFLHSFQSFFPCIPCFHVLCFSQTL